MSVDVLQPDEERELPDVAQLLAEAYPHDRLHVVVLGGTGRRFKSRLPKGGRNVASP